MVRNIRPLRVIAISCEDILAISVFTAIAVYQRHIIARCTVLSREQTKDLLHTKIGYPFKPPRYRKKKPN